MYYHCQCTYIYRQLSYPFRSLDYLHDPVPQEHVLAPTVLGMEVGHEHVQYVALKNVQIVKKQLIG